MSKSKPSPPPNSDSDFKEIGSLVSIQMTNPEINSIIKQYNDKYLYWDEIKRRDAPKKLTHTQLWQLVKFNRKISSKQIIVSKNVNAIFSFNYTDYIAKCLNRFDLNLGGVLEGSTTIPEDKADRYMINALMEEAIASSQLEGAVTTRKIAKELLRTERKPKNDSERMIINNFLTIQAIKKETESELSPELILRLHKIITNETLEDSAFEGEYRNSNEINVVDAITGEIYYSPPDYDLIPQSIKDICDFANGKKENEFIHPILRAITLHFMIGYLHPFIDGNGRTARAIFYWYLMSKGYWLVEYISISKIILNSPSQYARSYICTEDDENDLTYFFHYNLKMITNALKGFRKFISRQIENKTELYDLNRLESLNDRQAEIIFRIQRQKHKLFTIKEIQNTFGTAYQTARTDLYGLLELGLLNVKKSGNKRIFFKSDSFIETLKTIT